MPSKPPRSKAAKKCAKTAKPLPGKIKKRFKDRQMQELVDEQFWKQNDGKKSTSSTLCAMSLESKPSTKSLKGKKITRRLERITQREKIMGV